ncbi:antibiotic biosynthesis monooxygenase [Paraflavitalea pollutisoli]|uniref:antibiotic biosynthesis monooxygenase n=1 Tax=Paraflavitalea pollutisoli TaxID=3034143 RepID=UPI0023EC15EB|nr:antibiotic biosynthesis monooxygenase family protein [Paraflavitalea sp. H1-2-19X]
MKRWRSVLATRTMAMTSLLLTGSWAMAQPPAARLIRYEVKPASLVSFRQAVRHYIGESTKAPGNILSEAFQEEADSTKLWIIERWTNQSALDKASHGNAYKTITALSQQSLQQPARLILVKDLEPLSPQQWRRAAAPEDRPLTIMLFVDAKPGTASHFKAVYHQAMPQFRSEPGVINYQLSQLENDSTQFVTYEKFRNEAAFQYHLTFPPIQPVIDYLHTSIKQQPFEKGLHRLIGIAP